MADFDPDDVDNDEEYWALLAATAAAITLLMNDAYQILIKDIRKGTPTPEAVDNAMKAMQKEYVIVIGESLEAILGPIGDPLDYDVGPVKLSNRLWAEAQKTSVLVQGVVKDHVRGLQDSRVVANQLFDGFEIGKDEILIIKPSNQLLPKHMRDLLKDNQVNKEMAKAYSKQQTRALKTGALKAARLELLKQIDLIDKGSAAVFLDKKLEVAYNEKVRYFANRIAQTELARAYAIRQAREIMDDDGVKYVQYTLAPTHPIEDICDYFAGLNAYGLGRGIYPKADAPTAPAHPFCKCVLSKRPELNNKEIKLNEDADKAFFNQLNNKEARLVAGSANKLAKVKAGQSAWEVHNAGIDPIYQVKPAGSV